MAWLQDAVEEFKTLKPAGKFVVAGVLVAAAVIGYAVYRNRASAGGNAATPSATPADNTTPFTVTSTTPSTTSASSTSAATLPGKLIQGVVNGGKPIVSKVVSTVKKTTGTPITGIQPSKPIQTVVSHVTQAVQRATGTVSNQNRGVASRVAPNNYLFWKGPINYVQQGSPSAAEWTARAKIRHPIEINGTGTGGR